MTAERQKGSRYTLTFHGVRGSICAPGPATLRYGGATSCASIRLAESRWLVLDCGTGLRRLQAEIPHPIPEAGIDFDVLLSHYHWDHIQGLPFFEAIYDARARFTFYGCPWSARGIRSLLEEAIRPPWFPVSLDRSGAEKKYVDLDGGPFQLQGLTIRTARLHHPQGVTAYRLEYEGGAVVFATDTQWGDPTSDTAIVELCAGADTLIYDAQQTREEQAARRAYGHGTWEDACVIARRAGVRRLVLFHHDPDRSDEQIDRIVERARQQFAETDAAAEGLKLSF